MKNANAWFFIHYYYCTSYLLHDIAILAPYDESFNASRLQYSYSKVFCKSIITNIWKSLVIFLQFPLHKLAEQYLSKNNEFNNLFILLFFHLVAINCCKSNSHDYTGETRKQIHDLQLPRSGNNDYWRKLWRCQCSILQRK